MSRHLFTGAAALVAALTILAGAWVASQAAAQSYTFESVSASITTGDNIRLELKLIGPDGTSVPTNKYTILSTRLDMGPDGMAMMDTPLKPVVSSVPDILAYDTEIVMAGRWALAITVQIEDVSEPVSGSLIFTAAKTKADNAVNSPKAARDREILYYRNPMGLADVSPVPKKDSMGMDYIAVYADEASGPDGTITLSPEKIQRTGVRTETVQTRQMTKTVHGAGQVMADEARLAMITLKFSGFVEDLLVPTTGAVIEAGQPLVRIWVESQDLLAKQADFVTALRAGNSNLIASAEQNLRLFGVSSAAIDELRKTRTPTRSLTLAAPISGTVIDKPAMVGMSFSMGKPLYTIADLSTVWVMADIAEQDLSLIREGQRVSLTFPALPGETVIGDVGFIYPDLNPETRTGKVRIVLPNADGRLKPGYFARADISVDVGSGMTVMAPRSSVIDDGTRPIVFVDQGEGRFEPRAVTLGARSQDYIEVRNGLAPGERVVVRGNFLIDAESNLRAALAAFARPEQK